MTRWIVLALVMVLASRPWAQDVPIGSPFPDAKAESSLLHGTLDVVISTKEGFVLAADSRLTHEHGAEPPTYTDDTQKLFTLGPRAAVVMAGLAGTDMKMSGFRLSPQMGSQLVALDEAVTKLKREAPALWLARFFAGGFEGVVGLAATTTEPNKLVGQAEVVSILEDGHAEWVSVRLKPQLIQDDLGDFYAVAPPQYIQHDLSKGLHFNVWPIGQPTVVLQLTSASAPIDNGFSNSAVMRKYYSRKAASKLDDYTLTEAIELAMGLETESARALPRKAGVGGPIDVLTLTKKGPEWIQRKSNSAPFPPLYKGQYSRGIDFNSNVDDIDGLHCVHCMFSDEELYYLGREDVELLDPRIVGTCHLRITKRAVTRAPDVVEQLKSGLRGKCEVLEVENNNFMP
jgi:hypothetical protein